MPAGVLGDLAAGSQVASSPILPSEFYTPATPPQRQRRTIPLSQDSVTSFRQDDPSPTPSSHRTLRRTSGFYSNPSPRPVPLDTPTPSRRPHYLEAAAAAATATVGIHSPRPFLEIPGPYEQPFDPLRRQPSQSSSDDEQPPAERRLSFLEHKRRLAARASPTPQYPSSRLSKHRRSAILWALEDALRQPHPFTPDLEEENASMADLLGANVAPPTTNGQPASSSRPAASPAQTGSPQQVIRGPRVIMRERAEREARQRAEREREQMERARAEEEARLLEESRRQAEQRPSVAGAGSASDVPPTTDPLTQRRQQRAQESAQAPSRLQAGMVSPTPSQPPATVPPLRTRVPATTEPQASTSYPPTSQPDLSTPAPAQTGESSHGLGGTRIRNTFPHAFERWEALSAHWEGMTSFWLRRLQENTDEAQRNPIHTQLSRQVADLSAAGANLFHAVVELQRLRASSERKFQRWFFETRAELERHQEVNAMLEAQMEQERQARAEAQAAVAEKEAENKKLQKLLAEMRRELLISKEEARRAWEELGRREQEERDRTLSLQQGHPTLVGGVQVVPMTHGIPSRTTSRHARSQSQATTTSEYAAAQTGQYHEYGAAPAPVVPPSTSAGSDFPGDGYYHRGDPAGHDMADYGAGSDAGYSEGEYMIDACGNYVRDEHGNRIPFHSPSASPSRGGRRTNAPGGSTAAAAADDYLTGRTTPGSSQPPPSSHYPPTSSQRAADPYSGQGYATPGWETMPRHHHPTRLSDVIEEDERSRTSISQVSRA